LVKQKFDLKQKEKNIIKKDINIPFDTSVIDFMNQKLEDKKEISKSKSINKIKITEEKIENLNNNSNFSKNSLVFLVSDYDKNDIRLKIINDFICKFFFSIENEFNNSKSGINEIKFLIEYTKLINELLLLFSLLSQTNESLEDSIKSISLNKISILDKIKLLITELYE
jgi:hypothetical protein